MIHTHTIDDDSDGPPPKLSEKDWWKQGCVICADHDREILQHGQVGPGLTPHTHIKGVSEFTILGPERRKPVVEYALLDPLGRDGRFFGDFRGHASAFLKFTLDLL